MKVVNFVLGLGTVIIIAGLITLGIRAFYIAPQPPNFPVMPMAPACVSNSAQCISQQQAYNNLSASDTAEFTAEQATYENQIDAYNSNVFIIANIVGLIVFGFGFWLLFATEISAQSVPIGIMIAGIWGILYGYITGWNSVNNQLKFFIGLVIAVIVIGGSMYLIQVYAKKKHHA